MTIEAYRRSYRIDEWAMAPASVLEVASEKHSLPAPDRKTRNLRADEKLRRFDVSTGEGNTTGNLWLVNA